MINKYPTFSVIVSCFNSEKYITRAINALISNKLFEQILIIDDGSSDMTKEIIRSYESIDSRINCFYSKYNQGTVNQINLLIKNLKSDYVLFASSSDQISPLLVEVAKKDILKFGNCGLWYANAKYLSDKLFDKYTFPLILNKKSFLVKNPFDFFCKLGAKFEGSSGFFRVELVKKYSLNKDLEGLADCILGVLCSLEKGIIQNRNILSKVKKNKLNSGYLEKTYKKNKMDIILKIIKKELSKNNKKFINENNNLFETISAQIMYGYLRRKYININEIPKKLIFLIRILKILLYRKIFYRFSSNSLINR